LRWAVRTLAAIVISVYLESRRKKQYGTKGNYTTKGRLQMILLFNNLHKEESGQDIIEYILIAAFITVGVIATIGLIAGKVSGYWTSLKNQLT